MIRVKTTFVYMDRAIIKRKWKFNRRPLARAGAYIMRVARTSIRRRVNRNLHSRPGTPPYSHVGGSLPPFKQIFFEVDSLGMRVFVGMVGYGGKGVPVPGLQEHGGFARRMIFKQVGHRRLKRNFSNPRQGAIIRKRVVQSVRYPERPFMQPALGAGLTKLPEFWRNSLVF